jgi:uncharacterized protein (DUF952 family)
MANNAILRSDSYPELLRGKVYDFQENSNQLFAENIPVWLTNTNWTAQAEITILTQSIESQSIKGTFRVDYIYLGDEQKTLTKTFIRMYAGMSNEYIYLLSSQAEYQQALNKGSLTRDSLQSEGFIHATPRSQLSRLANKYHKETIQPLILEVDKELVSSNIKWEPATGGLYPHIYGELNINAVVKVEEISPNEEGYFHL